MCRIHHLIRLSGFYLDARLLPGKRKDSRNVLLLAPFCGKPACQLIKAEAGKGVCADSFVTKKPVLVSNVGELTICFHSGEGMVMTSNHTR